ncbi:unnamed protein product [Agarophyton chilense]
MTEEVKELCIQYGGDCAETLVQGGDDSRDDDEGESQIHFAEDVEMIEKGNKSSSRDDEPGLSEFFASEFGINFTETSSDGNSNQGPDPEIEVINYAKFAKSIQNFTPTGGEVGLIPLKASILPIHSSSQIDPGVFEGVFLDIRASTSVCRLRKAKAYSAFVGCRFKARKSRKKSSKVFRF